MTRPSKSKVRLTQRALRDLVDILEFSTRTWSRKVCTKYLSDLKAGLDRLQRNPALASLSGSLHASLRFYQVNQHLFVCDVKPGSIVVLSVFHASMDVTGRLTHLQPTLAAEVEMLHRLR